MSRQNLAHRERPLSLSCCLKGPSARKGEREAKAALRVCKASGVVLWAQVPRAVGPAQADVLLLRKTPTLLCLLCVHLLFSAGRALAVDIRLNQGKHALLGGS